MFANERHNIITKMLQKDGAVTTSALVKYFDVSIETIRRDLLTMEKQGLLQRVHGGAVSESQMKSFHSLDKRNEENEDLKRELSKNAVDLVKENDIIAIDTGSTAIFFAEELLKRFSKLTVITHSMDVFNILGGQKNFSVILCGGYYNLSENCFYGSLVTDTLQRLHADKCFIFPTAVSLKNGICDYTDDLMIVQKSFLSISNKAFILADSSKFEKSAMLKLDDMKEEYTYVTDNKLSESIGKLYEENNIDIIGGNKQ